MAEWSKAAVLGTVPKGREFKPHSCQSFFCSFLAWREYFVASAACCLVCCRQLASVSTFIVPERPAVVSRSVIGRIPPHETLFPSFRLFGSCAPSIAILGENYASVHARFAGKRSTGAFVSNPTVVTFFLLFFGLAGAICCVCCVLFGMLSATCQRFNVYRAFLS